EIAPARLLTIARGTTLAFMVISIAWAPLIQRFPGIFAYLQEVFSYAVPPVAAAYLGGVFWRGATRGSAFVALAGGHRAAVARFTGSKYGWWTLPFTVNAFVLFVVSGVLLVVASRLQPQEAVDPGTMWSPALSRVDAGTGLLRDYRLWAGLVALGVVA